MFSFQVEDAFESNDLDLVSEQLAGRQASLRLLHHVVDYQVGVRSSHVVNYQVGVRSSQVVDYQVGVRSSHVVDYQVGVWSSHVVDY